MEQIKQLLGDNLAFLANVITVVGFLFAALITIKKLFPKAFGYILKKFWGNRGVSKEAAKKFEKYRLAAEQGDVKAQVNLGNMYRLGEGVKQDYKEALKWYRRAIKRGDSKAQYNLGAMYALGEGVSKNPPKAYMWFYLAAQLGDRKAKQKCTQLENRLNQKQIKEAEKSAKAWLKKWRASKKDNKGGWWRLGGWIRKRGKRPASKKSNDKGGWRRFIPKRRSKR